MDEISSPNRHGNGCNYNIFMCTCTQIPNKITGATRFV